MVKIDTKVLSVRVTKEVYSKLCQAAASKNLSISKCLTDIVSTVDQEISYAVIPEYMDINGGDISVFKSMEESFLDAKEHYGNQKFVIYEIKKKGFVNLKLTIESIKK